MAGNNFTTEYHAAAGKNATTACGFRLQPEKFLGVSMPNCTLSVPVK